MYSQLGNWNCVNNDLIKNSNHMYDDKCYDGDGVKLNNNVICESFTVKDFMSDYDYEVLTNNCSAESIHENQSLKNTQCLVNRTLAKLFNSEGVHSHTLYLDTLDEYSCKLDCNRDVLYNSDISLQLLNKKIYYNKEWEYVVYLKDVTGQLTGYYLLLLGSSGEGCNIICCTHPPEGYLQVLQVATYQTLVVPTVSMLSRSGSNFDQNPKLTYDNYCKDLQVWQSHNCDYGTYLNNIIDTLIENEDQKIKNQDQDHIDIMTNKITCEISSMTKQSNIDLGSVGPSNTNIRVSSVSKLKATDFNYPDKKVGYLTQVNTEFSFIGPDREPVELDSVDTLLRVADIIKDSGQPNYKFARIPIKSGLKVGAWEKYLRDYSYKRVLQYIKIGFPLSLINPDELNNVQITNHFSACQYPHQVQEYIDKEVGLGAILGPVDNIIHENFHCSPLLTRPKDTNKRRVILNLSHPYGNSVNSHVDVKNFDGSSFILKFPTVDDIAQDIVECTEDTVLFKVDVAQAFRNLRVDPVDSLKFGISWRGAYYIDVGIAFGWTHGSSSFQILSDAIAYIMKREGIQLRCYIDDYIAVVPKSKADSAFHRLCDLLNELGLPINSDKLTPPTKRLTCLGIDFNIKNNTMSIAKDKLEAIYGECLQVSTKTSISGHKYQSLLGKLLYIQKCVKPARVFINRLLAVFRNNSHLKTIQLTNEFHRDIQWFLTFLPAYNGVSYIHKPRIDDKQSLYLDASLTGMGAVWRNRVYATPIHNCGDFDLKIVHLEMLNIIIALKVWGSKWHHSVIDIYCDNLGVVQVVETGKTRDPFLAVSIQNIWLITASLDIQLNINHIPGVHNVIADTLSRIYSDKPANSELLSILQDNFIWEHIPSHYFDLNLQL